LRKVGLGLEPDVLREASGVMSDALIEVEVSQQAEAERHGRRDTRTTYQNGHRERLWATRGGGSALRIPQLREGATSPVCRSRGGRQSECSWRWYSRPTSRG